MAVSSQKYNVIDLKTGLLDRRIFSDNDIYQEELEKIFGRSCWPELCPLLNREFRGYIEATLRRIEAEGAA